MAWYVEVAGLLNEDMMKMRTFSDDSYSDASTCVTPKGIAEKVGRRISRGSFGSDTEDEEHEPEQAGKRAVTGDCVGAVHNGSAMAHGDVVQLLLAISAQRDGATNQASDDDYITRMASNYSLDSVASIKSITKSNSAQMKNRRRKSSADSMDLETSLELEASNLGQEYLRPRRKSSAGCSAETMPREDCALPRTYRALPPSLRKQGVSHADQPIQSSLLERRRQQQLLRGQERLTPQMAIDLAQLPYDPWQSKAFVTPAWVPTWIRNSRLHSSAARCFEGVFKTYQVISILSGVAREGSTPSAHAGTVDLM